VVGFGLLSIVRWAGARLITQLAAAIPLVARAVPLLMLFAVVLFLTTEVWQVFAEMEDASLAAVVVLLVSTGTLFVVGRLPREVAALEEQVSAGGDRPPLRRVQRLNVGMVLFVSQALQVLVVALAVGVFFVVFGLLAIDDGVLDAWLSHAGHAIVDVRLIGVRIRPTDELLRVATAIAALSGLYYAIAVLTDSTYREEFLDEVTGDMRETFAERTRYLALRAG
jgi:amino acid transporter